MGQPKIVLGFVGKFCAGKGTVINYLKEKQGFYASSTSDRIREEILKNGQEITRETLQETGGKLREKFGPEVLAKRTWEKILEVNPEKAAVDSIRGIEEVKFLRKQPNFYLIAVNSDPQNRFERMVKRGRADPMTWEEFQESEKKDLTGGGRDIEGCIKLAQYKIENNGSEESLQQKIDKILTELGL